MRSWHRCGWVGPAVAVAFVAVLMAGCVGPGPPTTTSSDGSTSSGGGGSGGGGGSSDGGLAWVPFGPADPTIPNPDWPAYRSFARGRCSELRSYLTDQGEDDNFWQALVAVCAAAVDGDQDQWEVAARAFAAAEALHLDNRCLEDALREVVQGALDWHEGHPGRKPAVRFRTVAGRTRCGLEEPSETTEQPTETTEQPTETTEQPTETTEQPSETTEQPTETTS